MCYSSTVHPPELHNELCLCCVPGPHKTSGSIRQMVQLCFGIANTNGPPLPCCTSVEKCVSVRSTQGSCAALSSHILLENLSLSRILILTLFHINSNINDATSISETKYITVTTKRAYQYALKRIQTSKIPEKQTIRRIPDPVSRLPSHGVARYHSLTHFHSNPRTCRAQCETIQKEYNAKQKKKGTMRNIFERSH